MMENEPKQRRDSWNQEEYTEAEVTAGWAALEQMEIEDDSGLRAMKSAIGAQDWTPRHNSSKPGRPAAAKGGLWALGSPESLVDRIRSMAEGDFLVAVTDGALVKVMESTTGGWKSVPHMGGGGAGALGSHSQARLWSYLGWDASNGWRPAPCRSSSRAGG